VVLLLPAVAFVAYRFKQTPGVHFRSVSLNKLTATEYRERNDFAGWKVCRLCSRRERQAGSLGQANCDRQ